MLEPKYHQTMLENRQPLSQKEYEAFYNFVYPVGSTIILPKHQQSRYRLTAIKEHKRIYETN
jgi:3-hydroxy-3-methylglutaryl CoA synthase